MALTALAVALAYRYVHQLGVQTGVAVSRDAGGVHPALRVAAAAIGLFAVTGFGAVRLALPVGLRRHEPLWVLPTGACVTALEMTVLGYAGVGYQANLDLTIAFGALLTVVAVRRRGIGLGGVALRELGWPVYVAALIGFVALIPLFRSNFATVVGYGSDAHLAVGTAQFLQHHYPTSFHTGSPINQVPLEWRSKAPIYYAFAAVSTLSGLQPYAVISSLEAMMLVLTLLGIWLLCRDLLGTSAAAAAAACGLVGLDRMVLHTIMHPYYNQTWGMFVLPFALVLCWWLVGDPRRPSVPGTRRGSAVLLALFGAVCAFAYPLALPIPALALGVMAARDWRDRRRSGERPLWPPRRLWRGPRSLVWLVPLAGVLAVPLRGVFEKLSTGYEAVVNPTVSLSGWAGDLATYFPEDQFLSLRSSAWMWVAMPVLVLGIVLALRDRPRALRWGLVAVFVFGVVALIYFRARAYGYYFHFKLLAFVAPLALATAVAGLSRLRVVGALLIVGWLVLAYGGARAEVDATTNELPIGMVHLQALDRTLPPGSIRLDMDPGLQLWVAEMLPHHSLCSQTPVLNTAYPHVTVSRRADYILVDYQMHPPFDRQGTPIWRDEEFRLYRESPSAPGVDRCSERRVQTVTSISGG